MKVSKSFQWIIRRGSLQLKSVSCFYQLFHGNVIPLVDCDQLTEETTTLGNKNRFNKMSRFLARNYNRKKPDGEGTKFGKRNKSLYRGAYVK